MDAKQCFPVIIPAAGTGRRMESNTPKQYLKIRGVTILEHTINLFISHSRIDKIIVVINAHDKTFEQLDIASHPKVFKVIGGKERVDSVLAGLETLVTDHYAPYTQQYVLVHDAARPCLSSDELNTLIQTCMDQADDTGAMIQGAILATPVVDTLKKSQINTSLVESTVDRQFLWQAQTPQMFEIGTLQKAILAAKDAGIAVTDEASAMEFVGHNVSLVEGKTSNIKITRPSDISLAHFYLSQVN